MTEPVACGANTSGRDNGNTWCIDNDATGHFVHPEKMSYVRKARINYISCSELGRRFCYDLRRTKVRATGCGDLIGTGPSCKGEEVSLTMPNVRVIPGLLLGRCLFSVSAALGKNMPSIHGAKQPPLLTDRSRSHPCLTIKKLFFLDTGIGLPKDSEANAFAAV